MSEKAARISVKTQAQAETVQRLFQAAKSSYRVDEVHCEPQSDDSCLLVFVSGKVAHHFTVFADGQESGELVMSAGFLVDQLAALKEVGILRMITVKDDPRCTDPRWAQLEWEDFFGEEGWQSMKFGASIYHIRAGADERGYAADDVIGAVCQAMEAHPTETDFECESVSRLG